MEKRNIKNYYTYDKEIGNKMLIEVMAKGKASATSARCWLMGSRVPMPLYQILIQGIVQKYYGEKVPLSELFY